jgi:excisionase family DNA binding protein
MFVLTYQTTKTLSEVVPETGIVSFVENRVSNDLIGYIQITAPKNFPWYANQLVEHNPFLTILLGYIESPEPEKVERELRTRFGAVHHRGTWYRPSFELLDFIRSNTKRAVSPEVKSGQLTMPADAKLLDIDELATYLGISVPTVRRAVADGKIPVTRTGRLLRFYLPDVLTAIRSGKMPPQGS